MTAKFRALPLDDGLGRLLAGFSYVIIHDPTPDAVGSAATRQIGELMVFDTASATQDPRSSEASDLTGDAGSGPGLAGMEPTPEWTAALAHPDTAVRVEALQRWAAQAR